MDSPKHYTIPYNLKTFRCIHEVEDDRLVLMNPWYNIIQLLPALKVNIIVAHPRALARGKTTSQGWTITMFTASAGNNCFIIPKLYLQ
jgi:hypothetical protein